MRVVRKVSLEGPFQQNLGGSLNHPTRLRHSVSGIPRASPLGMLPALLLESAIREE